MTCSSKYKTDISLLCLQRTPTTLVAGTNINTCDKTDNSHASFGPTIYKLAGNGSELSNLDGAAEEGA